MGGAGVPRGDGAIECQEYRAPEGRPYRLHDGKMPYLEPGCQSPAAAAGLRDYNCGKGERLRREAPLSESCAVSIDEKTGMT